MEKNKQGIQGERGERIGDDRNSCVGRPVDTVQSSRVQFEPFEIEDKQYEEGKHSYISVNLGLQKRSFDQLSDARKTPDHPGSHAGKVNSSSQQLQTVPISPKRK